MNRCLRSLFAAFCMICGVLTVVVTSLLLPHDGAFAQIIKRPFPPEARRGMLVVTAAPAVLINDRPEQLSPGAIIRGANNMMVLSASLAGQPVRVNYLRDGQGQISAVWILTEEEAAERRAGDDTIIFNITSQPPVTPAPR